MRPGTRRDFLKEIAAVYSAAIVFPFGALNGRAANAHKVEIRKFKFKPYRQKIACRIIQIHTNLYVILSIKILYFKVCHK